ncbi:UDP-glucose/GDP-mannose dehydrogenase family protein [Mycolicibacterium novocastrense]|uniref:UDP-glucose 6-dehydrogenase n=1 Tax=Mycolicibacterium novocastrense TaxID=59813 RepID=A0AAW5SJX5_MYCNV|nr:UDP-glucose/GDP-mannose dehydrogenase family protein [Mycolicibacterium novocastrense]MCV7023407.1 UDP-glucose/GDP-mannose dehydrogenase family protein [Mycolicibacterium novocastrense]GAT12376.1 UDP-glucose 6-dehydrogenase [Mycolicibacterium novocastrense]
MNTIRAGVIGAGYVGLTTAVCLAERGHDTVCVDVDTRRVEQLRSGVPLLDEPGLAELLRHGLDTAKLEFSVAYPDLADCDVVFICVPTPSGSDGSADLSAVDAAVERLAAVLRPGSVLVLKSTVPVGTTRRIGQRVRHAGIRAVSNPEFLRESHAIYDFRNPDRIVIGADDPDAADLISRVYGNHAQTFRMSPESAELAKYASNAFLAVKISYANSLAQLCARMGADITDVTRCMGADVRIGPHFLQPGPGWGGSCLPKDTAAILHTGRTAGLDLPEIESARVTNATQSARIASTLGRSMVTPLGRARITALGLTFKAGTSDLRDSPALTICADLGRTGAQVTGYDPRLSAMDWSRLRASSIVAVDDPYLAAKDADAIVVLTEWPEFRELDWGLIAEHAPTAVVVDTRNLLDAALLTDLGLTYLGNGTPSGY